MSTTVPQPAQQPDPQAQQPYWQAQQPYWQPAPPAAGPGAPVGTSGSARPAGNGSLLQRWPSWAQNTALIVGAVAVLVVVFFAGFFTAHAADGNRAHGFGTNQNFDPRQFGGGAGSGGSGSGNGLGQSGDGS